MTSKEEVQGALAFSLERPTQLEPAAPEGTEPGTQPAGTDRHSSIRRVAIASFIGTTVEWYDFFLYGTATALVFDRLFFPNFIPRLATLAAFGTYAVGFLARPLGGIVCGHYGDRIGRKSMLVLTLLIMGIATFLIGVLPTYQTIGFWAPVLLVLLRLLQGFGVGGEWGGAVLMAVEHAPKNKRGFYGSWPQTGVPAGLLLATGVFALVSRMGEERFLAWGWRISFLLSVILIGVGLFVRIAVVESPAFAAIKEAHTEVKAPILDVLRNHMRSVLIAMGIRLAENAGFYIFSVFALTYATRKVGLPQGAILVPVLIASALEMVSLPLFAALSDRVGRRPVFIFGAVLTGVMAFPFFTLLDTRSGPLIVLAMFLALTIGHAAMYGPMAAFISELFGTRVRYSGVSVGYQMASVVAGGLSPLVAAAFLAKYDASWPVALLLLGMVAITLVSVYLARETAHREIAEVEAARE